MSVDTCDFERDPGQWWIQVLYPVIEGYGVSDERWGEPVVALLEDGRWWLLRQQTPVCFEVRVLGRAEPP